MKYSLSEIASIVTGKLDGDEKRIVTHLAIDSRNIQYAQETVFVAIETSKGNGHLYLHDAYQSGVRNFIVSEITNKLPDDAAFILVADTTVALQALATYHRAQYNIPVIAVTGSNGKTIVKEWLSQILSQRYFVIKSPKSYNSQIGVPLSVLEMNEHHEIAVFEAGISTYGEMQRLEPILKPTMGVFTNLGSAHAQGFKSEKDKATEKAFLFKNTKQVVFPESQELIKKALKKGQSYSWGTTGAFKIEALKKARNTTSVSLTYKANAFHFNLPFSDDSSIENALNVLGVTLLLGMDSDIIQKGLEMIQPLKMRLEQKKGVNGIELIDDTYNNDIQGLEVALSFLKQQGENYPKSLILSDLQQTDEEKKVVYKRVAQLVNGAKLKKFIGIGKELKEYKKYFGENAVFYDSKEAFIKSSDYKFQNEYLLIKGARQFAFESIVKGLEENIHDTRLEIDLGAIIHNYNYYRSLLKPSTKMMVMVKALSYGSGTAEIAKILEYNHVDYLAVAYVEEGVKLRQHGIKVPIMVMNVAQGALPKLSRYNLEPEVYSFEQLEKVAAYNPEMGIHLKLDTGMKRLGFDPNDMSRLLQILKNTKCQVKSIFTHLAGADESQHDAFTEKQFELFDELYARLVKALGYTPIKHALNSSGIVRFTNYQYDMVRLGIGLYGVEASSTEQDKLLYVGVLKTTISQVKKLGPDETVGYGRKGKVSNGGAIATIPIGYADGYDRRFSNGVGKVIVKGEKVPVIGNICMDMTMIDVSGLDVAAGDEVILFNTENPVWEYAEKLGTIPYELLTNISERVKRVFFLS